MGIEIPNTSFTSLADIKTRKEREKGKLKDN